MNQLYIYPLFFGFFSHMGYYRVLHRSPVLYNRFLLIICFIYSVCICQYQSLNLSLPTFLLGNHKFVSTSVTLSLFGNTFICTFFKDSTYKQYHMIFVFLCLTYFIQYDNLWVHPCNCKWYDFLLFYGLVIFHCIYVPSSCISLTKADIMIILTSK